MIATPPPAIPEAVPPSAGAPLREAQRTMARHLAALGVDPRRLADEVATLLLPAPPARFEDRCVDEHALPLFEERVDLGEVLGTGGMGEVLSAQHRPLRRSVAVKRVLDPGDADAVSTLRKEARVGAHVEHPNVVPVHAMVRLPGERADGMMMERISGRDWASMLVPPESEGERDAYLDRNLSVLVRVCNAVAFAHARGVLHLDLKPENVRVGDHGEVYVLDWGLAAAYGPHGPPWLAPAAGIVRVAGTPSYMAPELVAADGRSIGPPTDVYLLGGMLHHVLTGEPPHRGADIMEVLACAFLEERPPLPSWAPEGLATIVRRALAPTPSSRFQDIGSFREALVAAVAGLPAERALRTVGESVAALEGAVSIDEAALGECEVAVEELRRFGADELRRRALLARVVALRLDAAEAAEDPATIRRTVERARAAAPELPPALALRVDALAERLDRRLGELRALEALAFHVDASFGASERVAGWRLLGGMWGLVCLLFGQATRRGWFRVDYDFLFRESLAIAVVAIVAYVAMRRTLQANLANRRIGIGLLSCGAAVELSFFLGSRYGLPVATSLGLSSLLYAYYFLSMGIAIDRRILPGAACFTAAAVLGLAYPDYVHEILGIAGFATVLLVTAGWSRQSTRLDVA